MYALQSFHHLLYPQKALDKMMRVCKPDGRIVIIDVTPEFNKVDEYNRVEKLRDSSHVKASTFKELSNMMEEAGSVNLETKCQNLEMELDKLLEASSLNNDENRERIYALFKKDVKEDNLGMKSFFKRIKTAIRSVFTFLYLY